MYTRFQKVEQFIDNVLWIVTTTLLGGFFYPEYEKLRKPSLLLCLDLFASLCVIQLIIRFSLIQSIQCGYY